MNTAPNAFFVCVYVCDNRTVRNQGCIAHYTPLGTPWKCIFAQYVLPFIKTPLFIAQNLYDSYQLGHILTLDGCSTYGMARKYPSCYTMRPRTTLPRTRMRSLAPCGTGLPPPPQETSVLGAMHAPFRRSRSLRSQTIHATRALVA